VINEALYFGSRMPYSLLCPNQLRHNGLIVNDTPRAYDPTSSHSIILPGELNLPLKTRGVLSYLQTRRPTDKELKECDHYELTSPKCWEPYKLALGDEEDETPSQQLNQYSLKPTARDPIELRQNVNDRFIQALQSSLLEDVGAEIHEADVIAHEAQQRAVHAISCNQRQTMITKESLARRWYTGLESARWTLLATMQEGMRFVEGPIRLKTSQAHLRFPSLVITLYSDTLFSHLRSVRGYTCAQIFMDGHGFVRVYPMKSKSEAHHALMHFIHDVVSPKIS
jgi:hypothetical protein